MGRMRGLTRTRMDDYAGQRFSSLVKAVVDTGKAGSITLKVTVRPSTAGAMAVKPEVRVTMPKGLPAEALLWPTPEGDLVADDPRQEKLELRLGQALPKGHDSADDGQG